MTAMAPIYWEGRVEGCQRPGLTPAGSPAVAVALQLLRTFLPTYRGTGALTVGLDLAFML